ncbi:bifunctional biotin--[acetyl-CoA-carboxylase] ligase/biotin operon repressor BirA [Pseudomonas sp. F3-2]|uniref:bifunctional biotin--[acetyl-CoA-carboxylase] ligase/biotin operon repressor BirA n=1 Tax=Pseudomonas sp. F3-2 TaxID=3141539 RepID=UPI00315DD91B
MRTLLKLLGDGAFHSGEDLGRVLGVSRSAVWKKLQQVEAELGIEVHKVRGRGYRLAGPLHLLDADEIANADRGALWPVRIYDVIDSTNAEAMRLIEAGTQLPLLVLAEQQTAGRGRRGRKWVSPFAENLYYSLAVRIEGGMRQLEGMSLLVGLALVETLRELGVAKAGLKWPNDILVGDRKLAGVLLELTGDPADVCHVIIGVGVNVNMRSANEVDQAWTSMAIELGRMLDRNQVASRLSHNLGLYIARHREEGFDAFRDDWERNHLWQGRGVSLIAGDRVIEGTVLGIKGDGSLRLCVDGEERSFNGGELSLRLLAK